MLLSLCVLPLALRRKFARAVPRADSRDIQRHPIDRALRGQVEGFPVFSAPRKVVRMLWSVDRTEVFARRGKNPQTAGTGDVEVSFAVYFDSVDGVFAGRPR